MKLSVKQVIRGVVGAASAVTAATSRVLTNDEVPTGGTVELKSGFRGDPDPTRLPLSARIGATLRRLATPTAAAVLGTIAFIGTPGGSIPEALADPAVHTYAVEPQAKEVLDYWGGGGDSLSGQAYLKKDGRVRLDTGLVPFTRSYVQATAGGLRARNGSPVPSSTILDPAQVQQLQGKSSGAALDAMAATFGVRTSFAKVANEAPLYDLTKPWWWGLCAPWAWTSLHPKISTWVDVNGPEGSKGVWFAGQWLSRADLGNWTMATANPFVDAAMESIDAESISKPSGQGLINALQMLQKGAPGFVADIHNDALKGDHQTWNQPFFAADLDSKSLGLSAPATAALLRLAEADGWHPHGIKLVKVVGFYGNEDRTVRDAYEGPALRAELRWNIYVGVGEDGAVGWSIMAHDPRLKGIAGLPTTSSADPPDYLAQMSPEILDDAIAGRPNGFIDRQAERGAELRFYLGTLLPNAVPGHVRTAFEAKVKALPPGQVSAEAIAALAAAFPKVANAYSPTEWRTHFEARGLSAQRFGAIWPQ